MDLKWHNPAEGFTNKALTVFSYFAQIQLMDAKMQLEAQAALNQKTKDQLNAAELELNTFKMQQGSNDPRHALSSPSTPIIRGWPK